jgi:hypothetical protein
MNEIFLSYRRSDDPGYVGRLADSLQQKFGQDSVYRDVDSERAGGNWKRSVARSVAGTQVVLAVIGPEWQDLLAAGPSEERDWVRFELNQAKTLDIPVIPVRLAQAAFDQGRDIEDLNWLKDLQFFELADGQGRWETDITRLAEEVARITQLKLRTADQSSASVSQLSHGHQSPNIVSGGGSVDISYGKDSDDT